MGMEDLALTGNDLIVQEAKDRFRLCQEWYGDAWQHFVEDIKFRHGDSENGWQWPDGIRRNREFDRKPCLTMNVVRQHNFQIVNSMKQRKAAVKIIATGGPATQESAGIFKGIVRHIEYRSEAQSAYSTAAEFQVDGGIGWWRLVTEYCDNESFDQDIRILRVNDPMSIILDPDAQEKDKCDSKYGFVFDLIPKTEFKAAYPRIAKMVGDAPLLGGGPFANWVKKDHIWICEYFRKVAKHDRLFSFIDPATKERKTILESKLPDEVAKSVADHELTKIRDVWPEVVEWKLLAGDKVADSTIWPGKYIPLIPVLGEEIVVDGQYDCKGHTRAMKDPQRMYNYNASAQVEFVALQGKTPWVAAIEAIEGHEQYWQSANVINHSVLPYNMFNEEFPEKPIPPPSRTEPPNAAPGYEAGMQTAFNQMMMTSGQWQNQMGMMGNERTGAAIDARTDQGDNATYHFQDNFALALRYTGKQIIDLVPKIYDTKRILTIIADDGSEEELEIDPAAKQAYIQHINHQGQVIKRIFNPNAGAYGIAADVGPSYASKQNETVDKMTLVLTQAPTLVPIIGDLLLGSMDFEAAQEAARRMKRMVPPQALGQGPSPSEQELTQKVAALQVALAKALEDQAKVGIKLVGKARQQDVQVYDAETRRMAALSDMLQTDPEDIKDVIEQLVRDALSTHLNPVSEENDAIVADGPPLPGARKAPDGQWYVKHPGKAGKYLRVKSKREVANASG